MSPSPLDILSTFAMLSLLAVGGANALSPEMHRILVDSRGWMDDATFSQLYALAQAAPGPNILSASVMGMAIGGWGGMALATIGILTPAACLAWTVAGWLEALKGAWWIKPAQAGLVPLALGLMGASGFILGEAAAFFVLAPFITAGSALFIWRSDRSPLFVLLAGGMVGLCVYALG
jgi:chromate transporter